MAKLRDRKIRRYAVWAFYMDGDEVFMQRCLDIFHTTFKKVKWCIDHSIIDGFIPYLPEYLQGHKWTSIKIEVYNTDNGQEIAYRKTFINQ